MVIPRRLRATTTTTTTHKTPEIQSRHIKDEGIGIVGRKLIAGEVGKNFF